MVGTERERLSGGHRAGHGLAADPTPPVSSYVGYSLDEPWGQPRVVFGLAADEAEHRDGQGAHIKSEHLLLGLLREEEGIIADLLGDFGTSVETVRTKVLESLRDSNAEGIDETRA